MSEQWKPVVGYEGRYEVSSFGQVRGVTRQVSSCYGSCRGQVGVLLKLRSHRDGYLRAKLCNGTGSNHRSVHQLVAAAFLPNPDNLPCVNHKDFDRKNNHASNLEWCSYQENNDYTIRHGRAKAQVGVMNGNAVRIEQIDPATGRILCVFETMTAAAESIGAPLGSLSGAISRGYLCAGYRWRRVGKTRRLCAALGAPLAEG